MSTMQLVIAKGYYTQMVMNTITCTYDVIFTINFKNTCLMRYARIEWLIKENTKKGKWSKVDRNGISCLGGYWCWAQKCKIICNTNIFHNCQFFVHTQNQVVSEGWVSIIICNLTYAKYDVYPIPGMNVHKC